MSQIPNLPFNLQIMVNQIGEMVLLVAFLMIIGFIASGAFGHREPHISEVVFFENEWRTYKKKKAKRVFGKSLNQ